MASPFLGIIVKLYNLKIKSIIPILNKELGL
jgi:hypothetical protein